MVMMIGDTTVLYVVNKKSFQAQTTPIRFQLVRNVVELAMTATHIAVNWMERTEGSGVVGRLVLLIITPYVVNIVKGKQVEILGITSPVPMKIYAASTVVCLLTCAVVKRHNVA